MDISNIGAIEQECTQLAEQRIHGIQFKHLYFAIMHGNGNVILVVDKQRSRLADEVIRPVVARALCETFTSIKIDGIAFLDNSNQAIKMTFFDRDGTEEPMCGNGLRCSTRYAFDRGYIQGIDSFMTDDGRKWVSASTDHVEVSLGDGREFAQLDPATYFTFTSVAHLVAINDAIDAIDVKREGAGYRYDSALCSSLNHPEGVHVNFLEPHEQYVYVRTYEVGVEDETASCGSGAAASAYIAHRVLNYQFPITIRTRGGDIVVNQRPEGLTIQGLVEYIYASY